MAINNTYELSIPYIHSRQATIYIVLSIYMGTFKKLLVKRGLKKRQVVCMPLQIHLNLKITYTYTPIWAIKAYIQAANMCLLMDF